MRTMFLAIFGSFWTHLFTRLGLFSCANLMVGQSIALKGLALRNYPKVPAQNVMTIKGTRKMQNKPGRANGYVANRYVCGGFFFFAFHGEGQYASGMNVHATAVAA